MRVRTNLATDLVVVTVQDHPEVLVQRDPRAGFSDLDLRLEFPLFSFSYF